MEFDHFALTDVPNTHVIALESGPDLVWCVQKCIRGLDVVCLVRDQLREVHEVRSFEPSLRSLPGVAEGPMLRVQILWSR